MKFANQLTFSVLIAVALSAPIPDNEEPAPSSAGFSASATSTASYAAQSAVSFAKSGSPSSTSSNVSNSLGIGNGILSLINNGITLWNNIIVPKKNSETSTSKAVVQDASIDFESTQTIDVVSEIESAIASAIAAASVSTAA
ncbi:unnamed protein product [Ambrosiozyma monospora]|uniref:Unnamed protein product n=1 Tax=Ambrosiozyma monospora TaxID=43982 RepID=A0A9W6TB17_AMBMO|nr:unnamed protein product [Ambrosiozyma monospora]